MEWQYHVFSILYGEECGRTARSVPSRVLFGDFLQLCTLLSKTCRVNDYTNEGFLRGRQPCLSKRVPYVASEVKVPFSQSFIGPKKNHEFSERWEPRALEHILDFLIRFRIYARVLAGRCLNVISRLNSSRTS